MCGAGRAEFLNGPRWSVGRLAELLYRVHDQVISSPALVLPMDRINHVQHDLYMRVATSSRTINVVDQQLMRHAAR